MSSFGAPTSQNKSITPNDCAVPSPGTDGISSLNFCPTANYLVSSNWDSTVTCWEVQEQSGAIRANPLAQGMSLKKFKAGMSRKAKSIFQRRRK